MKVSGRTVAISLVVGLILGLLAGFVPQHQKNSILRHNNLALAEGEASLQNELAKTQARLAISALTVRSAVVYVEAEKHDYSVALGNASSLFTDLRKFADQSSDANVKQQLEQVLSTRDQVIAGLAKADPAVVQALQDMFLKMQSIRDSGN
jgi:hypothetical protein